MIRPTDRRIETAASAWFARLQGEASETDWRAFTAWLEADPRHRTSYDAIEAAWMDAEDPASAWTAPIVAPASRRRTGSYWLAGLTAAAAALAVTIAVSWPQPAEQVADLYKTDLASGQAVRLADGSEIALNRATEVSVTLGTERRDVNLVEGEVSFDVAPDKARPFYIAAGDSEIRVTGTEFNVVRHDGGLEVTVRRGQVVVTGGPAHTSSVLEPGMRLSLAPGDAAARIEPVDANDAFAWRQGHLVYKNAPLARVAGDLGRYFGKPVHVRRDAAAIKVSGVLQIDEEAKMLQRLALFVPIAVQSDADEIVLNPR